MGERGKDIFKAAQIEGWMSNPELHWLADMAKDKATIIEFGSYFGRSTRALGDNCPGVVYAVDPWDGLYFDNNNNIKPIISYKAYEGFQKNLRDLLESNKVVMVRSLSEDFCLDIVADMIFIDGDHRYKQVIKDIEKARKLVKKGGLISGHDYGHPEWTEVKRAVDEQFKEVFSYETIWWTNNE